MRPASPAEPPVDWVALAEFRYQIRRFLHTAELHARDVGLTPQQVQLLLVIKGTPDGERVSIRHVAERLLIQHHSAVELVDRAVESGLIVRGRSEQDRRRVELSLSALGASVLTNLVQVHRQELRTVGPALISALQGVTEETT
jgi:DNA-binding MarR family transcriptional regulator